MAIIIFYVWTLLSNTVLIDAKKSEYLINQIVISNPINIYYAAIAGVFLALSGFISGHVDNKLKFSKTRYRIEGMSILSVFFSQSQVNRIALYIENHFGAFIGNLSLGFLLGSAFLFGDLFSIPFDIRHIAFSASYLGALVLNEGLTSHIFWNCFIGVWMIGVVNFVVSFLITFSITLKTRGITMIQLIDSSKGLLQEFLRYPLSFFYFRKPVIK